MNIAVSPSPRAAVPGRAPGPPDYEVIIVGAGISGLGTAIRLQQEGITSYLILERSSGVGGTWRDNRYPGIAVDITSFTYSYSFEQNPNWSRVFAPGNELHHYTKRVASKYGLYPSIRFGISVLRADFDETEHVWRLQLDSGEELTARHLVSATGGLITPKLPDIAGLTQFKGQVLHTARWDDSVDLSGKRVAVIGTGATAVQLIPEIAPLVSRLDVHQRTPIWVLKKPDRELPAWLKSVFRLLPPMQRAVRTATDTVSEALMVIAAVYYKQAPWIVRRCEEAGLRNLREQLPDRPDLWEKLTPTYGFGCKRPTFSNVYFQTFARDNVQLITAPIDRLTESGIRTQDGTVREIDVLILATGYKTFEKGNLPSYAVHGRNGVELGSYWDENRYQAYEGLTVHGFPNFYIMLGPYALIGTSYFKMVEGNAIHLTRCIKEARRRKATCVEVRKEVHDRYFQDIQRRQQSTVFLNHNCAASNSYYFDRHGDAPMLRPSTSVEMLWRARHFPLDHYRYQRKERQP
ncbi:MAG: monooxygenase [Moraxellaceae bacterium]|jgi:cation diffusion facilitator CzcD-associated flavoprotein CzcO|nr:monooxygenase [Moraxellaceae bacterium]